MAKAQSEIISAVLIIIIAIGLVGAAYSWGLPLIQKKQDEILVKRVLNYFDQDNTNSLPSKIERVANNGGEETFSIDVDGVWILKPYSAADSFNNSLTFSFFSRVSNFGIDKWIPLTTGASCPPSKGTLGLQKTSVICARADPVANGYNVTYTVVFREIESGTKTYKINLVNAGPADISTGKNIRISRGEVSGLNLIETTIKILFG